MARLGRVEKLPTAWTVPDDRWDEFALPREHDPEPRTGRPRTDPRRALDRVIHVMRTGSQRHRLPREFGRDSAGHRAHQRRVRLGTVGRRWAALVEYARPLGLVKPDRQSADTATGEARLGGAWSARDPRAGSPRIGRSRGRSGRPRPRAAGTRWPRWSPGRTPRTRSCWRTRWRPRWSGCRTPATAGRTCAWTKGYDTPAGEAAARVSGYRPHIRRIGGERLDAAGGKTRPARRRVVEQCLSWWNGCRGILARRAKPDANYLAFLQLDSALLRDRKIRLRPSFRDGV